MPRPLKRFIVNKVNRSMAPAEVIESVIVDAEYFDVNSNGDLLFYTEYGMVESDQGSRGEVWRYKATTAFSAGNWLTVDGQTLNASKDNEGRQKEGFK